MQIFHICFARKIPLWKNLFKDICLRTSKVLIAGPNSRQIVVNNRFWAHKALITQKYSLYGIRYTVFAIRYTIRSPPQTRFCSFHATSLECRLWRRANRIQRIANTGQRILLCDQGLRQNKKTKQNKKKVCLTYFCQKSYVLCDFFLENELRLCDFFPLSNLITKWYRKQGKICTQLKMLYHN